MASPDAMGAAGQAARKLTRNIPQKLEPEFRKGVNAVAQALYNPQIMQPAMDMLNESEKVGSTAKAVTSILSQVTEKAMLVPRIMPTLTMASTKEFIDMAQESGAMEYSETEIQQTAMTALEMILNIYGVSEQEATRLAQQMTKQQLQNAETSYDQILNAGGEANA